MKTHRVPLPALLGLSLAVWLARAVPSRWLVALGRAAAPALLAFIPGLRADLAANARRLLGPRSSTAARRRLSQRTLAHFARFVIELASPAPAIDESLYERMTGRAHYDAARAVGRGVIAVSLHFGHYEAGPSLLARHVQPLAILYDRDPSGVFQALRSSRRAQAAIEEIEVGGSMFAGARALHVLRRNGLVLAAGDLGAPGLPGRPHAFLGGIARFAELPLALALSTGAPLLPCFIARREGRYLLDVEPAIVPGPGDDAQSLLARLVPAFERALRAAPDQWLIIHRYWTDAGATLDR